MPSLSVNGRIAEQPLAAEDLALDHPIERAAVDELVGALRHHPGGVDVLGLLAGLFLLLQPLLDPVLEVLDRVAADAELEEMQWHGDAFSTGGPARSKFRHDFPRFAHAFFEGAPMLETRRCRGPRAQSLSRRRDRQDRRAFGDLRADLRGDLADRSVDRREQRVLHLHRLDHRDALALGARSHPASTKIASTLPCIGALTTPSPSR